MRVALQNQVSHQMHHSFLRVKDTTWEFGWIHLGFTFIFPLRLNYPNRYKMSISRIPTMCSTMSYI